MKLKHILSILAVFALTACTQNERAKSFGGSVSVPLPAGQKLITATWKDHELWYLTRPMRAGEFPETHTMIEDSSWGIIEGKVIFSESK